MLLPKGDESRRGEGAEEQNGDSKEHEDHEDNVSARSSGKEEEGKAFEQSHSMVDGRPKVGQSQIGGRVVERLAALRVQRQVSVCTPSAQFVRVESTASPKLSGLEHSMHLRAEADVVAMGMAVERRLAPLLPRGHKLLPMCIDRKGGSKVHTKVIDFLLQCALEQHGEESVPADEAWAIEQLSQLVEEADRPADLGGPPAAVQVPREVWGCIGQWVLNWNVVDAFVARDVHSLYRYMADNQRLHQHLDGNLLDGGCRAWADRGQNKLARPSNTNTPTPPPWPASVPRSTTTTQDTPRVACWSSPWCFKVIMMGCLI